MNAVLSIQKTIKIIINDGGYIRNKFEKDEVRDECLSKLSEYFDNYNILFENLGNFVRHIAETSGIYISPLTKSTPYCDDIVDITYIMIAHCLMFRLNGKINNKTYFDIMNSNKYNKKLDEEMWYASRIYDMYFDTW